MVLTVSKCDNVDPFFPLKFDYLVLKTHFISEQQQTVRKNWGGGGYPYGKPDCKISEFFHDCPWEGVTKKNRNLS